MQPSHNIHPVLEIFISVILFASSAVLGCLQDLDLILSIVAKLVAIGAGASTIILAYLNYRKSVGNGVHDKGLSK